MCTICIQFDKNRDVEEFRELITNARREVGSVDPHHLDDLTETLIWLEEEDV